MDFGFDLGLFGNDWSKFLKTDPKIETTVSKIETPTLKMKTTDSKMNANPKVFGYLTPIHLDTVVEKKLDNNSNSNEPTQSKMKGKNAKKCFIVTKPDSLEFTETINSQAVAKKRFPARKLMGLRKSGDKFEHGEFVVTLK